MALLDRFIRKEIEPQADLVSDLKAVSDSKKNNAFAVEYTISRILNDADRELIAEAEERGEASPIRKLQKIVIVFNSKSEVVLAYDIHDHLDIGYRMLWGTDSEYAEFVDDAAKMSKGVDTNRHYVFANHFSQNVRFVEYLDVIYTDYVLQKISELYITYEAELIEERVVEDISKSDANKIGFFNSSLDEVEAEVIKILERKKQMLNKIGLSEIESDELLVEDVTDLDDREDINKLLIAASESDNDTSLRDIRERANGFLWVDVLSRIASSNERGWLKLINPETREAIPAHGMVPAEAPDRQQFESLTTRYDEFSLSEDDMQLGRGAEVIPGDHLPEGLESAETADASLPEDIENATYDDSESGAAAEEAEEEAEDIDNVERIFDDIVEGNDRESQFEAESESELEIEFDSEQYDNEEQDVFEDEISESSDALSQYDSAQERAEASVSEISDESDTEDSDEQMVIELPENASSWSWEDGNDIFAEDEQSDREQQDENLQSGYSGDESYEQGFVTPEDIEISLPEETSEEETIEAETSEEEDSNEEPEEQPEKNFYVPLDNEFPSFFTDPGPSDSEEPTDVTEESGEQAEERESEDFDIDSVVVGSGDDEDFEDELYRERILNDGNREDDESDDFWSEISPEEDHEYEVSSEYSDHVKVMDENDNFENEETPENAVEFDDEASSTDMHTPYEENKHPYEQGVESEIERAEETIHEGSYEERANEAEESDSLQTESEERPEYSEDSEFNFDVLTSDQETAEVIDSVNDSEIVDDSFVAEPSVLSAPSLEDEESDNLEDEAEEDATEEDTEANDVISEDVAYDDFYESSVHSSQVIDTHSEDEADMNDDDEKLYSYFEDFGDEEVVDEGTVDTEDGQYAEGRQDFVGIYEDSESSESYESFANDVENKDDNSGVSYQENGSDSLPVLSQSDSSEEPKNTESLPEEDDTALDDDYPEIDHIDADAFMREYNSTISEDDGEPDTEESENEFLVLGTTESGITQDSVFDFEDSDQNEFMHMVEELVRDKQRADEKMRLIPLAISQNQKSLEDLQYQADKDNEEIVTLNERFDQLKQQQLEVQEELENLFPEIDDKSAYAVMNQQALKQKSILLERLEADREYYAKAREIAESLLQKVEKSGPVAARSVGQALEKILSEEKTDNENESENMGVEYYQITSLVGEGGGVIESERSEGLRFRDDGVNNDVSTESVSSADAVEPEIVDITSLVGEGGGVIESERSEGLRFRDDDINNDSPTESVNSADAVEPEIAEEEEEAEGQVGTENSGNEAR